MVEPAPKLPPKPVREQARVLYAYDAQNDDELTIREGDIINVISKEIEDQGWFKGELNGKIGVFPDNFVELIKVPIGNDDDKPAPPRPKAAPPATGGSSPTAASGGGTIASVTKSLTSSTGKSSSTSVADGNSHSSNGKITSSTNNNDPSPKTTSIFGLKKTSKPSSSSLPKTVTSPSGVKHPDVIPSQETRTPPPSNESSEGIRASPDTTLSSPLSGIEPSMGSKLSHLTANRPKGPSNRRPPSYISNRDASQDNSVTPSSLMSTSLTENGSDHSSSSHPFKANGTSSTTLKTQPEVVSSTKPSVLTSPVKGKEDPPWMVELRKTQEAKKASGVGVRSSSISTSSTDGGHPHLSERSVSLDSSSSESSATSGQPIVSNRGSEATTAKPPTSLMTTPSSALSKLNSPSPRGSGDFSSRLGPFNGSDVSSSSVLKPVKPLKPTTGGNASSATSPAAASTSVAASSTSVVNAAVKSSPSTSSSSLVTSGASHQQQQASSSSITTSSSTHLSSPSTTAQQQTPTTQQQSSAEPIVSGGGSCIADLQREIKILRESSVSRKEYEDLRRQISELRDALEAQKSASRTLVNELINDMAEDRKKLATLQIEIDRLRKLTTTV